MAFLSILVLTHLIAAPFSAAEIKIITATGEYRMGDNDTRTDAKRLALLDAKRLALEQAGTYLESVTEVKNLGVTRDELNAYTAGIVEVTEVSTKDVLEAITHVLRVQVVTKIDTGVVWSAINGLRNNDIAKAQLLAVRDERDRLRRELDERNRELVALKTNDEISKAYRDREKTITKLDVNSLLARALVESGATVSNASPVVGTSSPEGRLRARKTLYEALDKDPANPMVHNGIGLLLMDERKFNEAYKEFHVALLNNSPYPETIHSNLGMALTAMHDYKGAINEYREALKINPDLLVARNNLGEALRTNGDYDGAIAEYRTVLKLDPKHVIALNNLGLALHEKGDEERAIENFRAAIQLNPNLAIIHNNLGEALAAKGDIDGAISEYRKGLEIQPDAAFPRMNLGLALVVKGEHEKAIAEFRKAQFYQPDLAFVHIGLGAAYKAMGRLPDASREFKEYLRMAPDTALDRLWTGRVRAMLADIEK